MPTLVPRTWIAGVPRGYGNNRVAAEWLQAIEHALSAYRNASVAHPEHARYNVAFEFHIDPTSARYGAKPKPFRIHGPDVDNLVKQTLDGLAQTRSKGLPPGLRIVTDDKAVHRVIASKVIVSGDDRMGAWVKIRFVDGADGPDDEIGDVA